MNIKNFFIKTTLFATLVLATLSAQAINTQKAFPTNIKAVRPYNNGIVFVWTKSVNGTQKLPNSFCSLEYFKIDTKTDGGSSMYANILLAQANSGRIFVEVPDSSCNATFVQTAHHNL